MEEESRMERAAKSRKKWRTRWLLCSGVMVLVLIGLAGAYWYMQPQRHFNNVPVLSEPHPPPKESSPLQPTAPSSPQDPSPQDSSKNNTSFNVLILGIDAREGEQDSRSDVIMVAHVKLADKTINLVSIPRDTRVNLQGIGETKINHAHFIGNLNGGNHGGTDATIRAVSDFLHVQINYYAKMNFQGFQQFVDSIGGVSVTFPYAVRDFSAGTHHLNGEQTLIAVRERYSLPNGDFGRQADQSLVLRSMLQQLLQVNNIPHLPAQIKQVRRDVIDTNFTDSDLLSLAMLFKGMNGSQVHYEQIPGHDGMAMDPLVKMQLYYWIPDLQAVQKMSDVYLHDNLQ